MHPPPIPKGARVRKRCSEPDDLNQDGALGTVERFIGPVNLPEYPNIRYFYFVYWDDLPGVPIGVHGGRIEEIKETHHASG